VPAVTQKTTERVHGTWGKSEDWSRSMGELSSRGRWIRQDKHCSLRKKEPTKAPYAKKDLADEVVAISGPTVSSAFILSALARRGSCHMHPAGISERSVPFVLVSRVRRGGESADESQSDLASLSGDR